HDRLWAAGGVGGLARGLAERMGRRQAAHASRWTSDRPLVSPEGRIFGRFGPVGRNSDPPTLAARATARFESRRSAGREGGSEAISLHLRMTRGGDCFVGRRPSRNDKEDTRLFT